jgi:hypothetical protein
MVPSLVYSNSSLLAETKRMSGTSPWQGPCSVNLVLVELKGKDGDLRCSLPNKRGPFAHDGNHDRPSRSSLVHRRYLVRSSRLKTLEGEPGDIDVRVLLGIASLIRPAFPMILRARFCFLAERFSLSIF